MKATLNTITQPEEPKKELKYPLIAVSIPDVDTIVLFVTEFEGIALKHMSKALKRAITSWTPVTNTKVWRILAPHEYVALSNEP